MLDEFRQDPVSGDWVLFSEKRAGRPYSKEKIDFSQSKEDCPFEGDFKDQEKTLLLIDQGKLVDLDSNSWTTRVIKNKYPVVIDGLCSPIREEGEFFIAGGTGSHELVITKDHDRQPADLSDGELAEVLSAYRARYEVLSRDPCTRYVSIFHNHGHLAGASVYHNHSQIVSMPLVPSLIERSVSRAREHLKRTGQPIYDSLLAFDLDDGKRTVAENDLFVAFCPYVSRSPYAVKIFPKTKQASFGEMTPEQLPHLANALGQVLRRLKALRDDPDYIYFVRTAPLNDDVSHQEYRWHLEIMPRESPAAGLELGTDVFINTVDPDMAAQAYRSVSI
ncbi:MAG TPA: DUF4921 family protein [Candidatus Paceibacterota bacterium]|nr:DUF4921 family protein [Candidatus Paceibacterota bacterium]